jgi:hypothetical protein
MTADLRSPVWLEASFRHARDYQPDSKLAAELVENDAVEVALRHLMVTMSNRQLRETGDSAARWITDLIKCEEEGPLSADLKKWKVAMQVICDLAQTHRLHRCTGSKNGTAVYRRQ